jgi:hypothetical protein
VCLQTQKCASETLRRQTHKFLFTCTARIDIRCSSGDQSSGFCNAGGQSSASVAIRNIAFTPMVCQFPHRTCHTSIHSHPHRIAVHIGRSQIRHFKTHDAQAPDIRLCRHTVSTTLRIIATTQSHQAAVGLVPYNLGGHPVRRTDSCGAFLFPIGQLDAITKVRCTTREPVRMIAA